ncbi:MAG TPA: 2OG-Fe(II) oxygenase [Elusimicrobiota bacterium]|nr:2OG-Fe(II) oxygenase [Elusimicrobiota bacterium]
MDHELSPSTLEYLHARLLNLMPRLEKHFNEKLALREPLGIRSYGPGGFLAAHTDCINKRFHVNKTSSGSPTLWRLRRVSVIVYLSTEASRPAEGRHCGGPLVFYGLFPDRRARNFGLPLHAESGLLVAFRAMIGHEVRPVLAGTRYTVTAFISAGNPE